MDRVYFPTCFDRDWPCIYNAVHTCLRGPSRRPRPAIFRPAMPSSFQVLLLVQITLGAFTIPTSYVENTVQQNAQHTWCYYPAAGETRDISCTANFESVLLVHLNTTTAIGYYAPDNTRYGGADWPVPLTNPGKVTLCVSGRAQDGTYQTACMFVSADNSLPIDGGCWVAIAQNTVTDGCYVPLQLAVPSPSSLPPTQTTTSSPEAPPSPTLTSTNTVFPTTQTTSITPTSPTPSPTGSSQSNGGLSTSDKIAVAFGVISALGVLGVWLRWWWTRKKPRREQQRALLQGPRAPPGYLMKTMTRG